MRQVLTTYLPNQFLNFLEQHNVFTLDAQLTDTSWQGKIQKEIVRDEQKDPQGWLLRLRAFEKEISLGLAKRNLIRPGLVV